MSIANQYYVETQYCKETSNWFDPGSHKFTSITKPLDSTENNWTNDVAQKGKIRYKKRHNYTYINGETKTVNLTGPLTGTNKVSLGYKDTPTETNRQIYAELYHSPVIDLYYCYQFRYPQYIDDGNWADGATWEEQYTLNNRWSIDGITYWHNGVAPLNDPALLAADVLFSHEYWERWGPRYAGDYNQSSVTGGHAVPKFCADSSSNGKGHFYANYNNTTKIQSQDRAMNARREFIKASYRFLLGREPDSSGMNHYLNYYNTYPTTQWCFSETRDEYYAIYEAEMRIANDLATSSEAINYLKNRYSYNGTSYYVPGTYSGGGNSGKFIYNTTTMGWVAL